VREKEGQTKKGVGRSANKKGNIKRRGNEEIKKDRSGRRMKENGNGTEERAARKGEANRGACQNKPVVFHFCIKCQLGR